MALALGFRGNGLIWTRIICPVLAGMILLCCASPVRADNAQSLRPWAPDGATDFSLDRLDGAAATLADFDAPVVLVHFFATWCEPCIREMAGLDTLGRDLGDRIAIVAIDVGEPDSRVRKFFEQNPVGFPALLDRDRAVMKQWGVMALPSSFVLTRGLRPQMQAEGEVDWGRAEVRDLLERLAENGST